MAIYEKMFGKAWNGLNETRSCDELIVIAEQGFGDTIQFCRLMMNLKERGIKASLFCQEVLAGLLRDSGNIGKIRTTLDQGNDRIRWCPLLSLPHRLGIYDKNNLACERYIIPNDDIRKKWARKLVRSKGEILVGIHWQGNPKFEKTIYSAGRSIPVEEFKIFSGLTNIKFLILQKGPYRNNYKEAFGLDLVDAQAEFDSTFDFRETAGAISNCDLILSSDSSVAHLAGAIGMPTWIMLSKIPEWRWGLTGDTCQWYENTKLYRQNKRNSWSEVMKRVFNDLRDYKP